MTIELRRLGHEAYSCDIAEKRMTDAMVAGFLPYAMLYRDEKGERDPEWMKFQREWLRPAITGSKMREIWNE